MRQLNVKQKKLIDKWFEENFEKDWRGSPNIFNTDDMTVKLQQELQALNDYETVWMDADRYIGDKVSQEVFINNGW